MLLLNYSRKFHYHMKKIEEGDKKQKQFQVPFFILSLQSFVARYIGFIETICIRVLINN